MGVRIDTAWHHILSTGIHNLDAIRGIEVGTDLGDLSVRTEDIGAKTLFRRYHCTAFN
jgi:hypothetical protein